MEFMTTFFFFFKEPRGINLNPVTNYVTRKTEMKLYLWLDEAIAIRLISRQRKDHEITKQGEQENNS